MAENHQLPPGDPESNRQFVSQFLVHQRRIYRYILTLCPHIADAEDILQKTAEVLWAKFEEFEPGTNFLAWANRVAHLKVLEHRRAQRAGVVVLDDDVLQRLAEVSQSQADTLNQQQDALFECLDRLRPVDRQLIELSYAPNTVLKHVAQHLGRPANSVSKSLGRIRRWLMECAQRTLNRQLLNQGLD